MDVRLGNLTEYEDDLDDLPVHIVGNLLTTRHDIQQRRRQWIQKPFSDKHATEVILRRRALQLEDAANAIQRVDDELGLLSVVLIQQVYKHLQTTTSNADEVSPC